jgi:DNA-directed RNA polymerase subunit M/transcription elongation factor TFIIS
LDAPLFAVPSPNFPPHLPSPTYKAAETKDIQENIHMAKIAKTADRKKIMDTTKSTDCPKCGKPTRIVKRVKDRERNTPGGIFISCSGCEFYEKL